MRILYVARHGTHDNGDEDAIGWSLEKLGHNVFRADEARFPNNVELSVDWDLLLFHKWQDLRNVERIKARCKAFWYFDLIHTSDPTLWRRSDVRHNWLDKVLPLVDLGFLTDGDCVVSHGSAKLRHLMQGCDERVAGYGTKGAQPHHDILFTGMIKHGLVRERWVEMMKRRYGEAFYVFGDAPRFRVHGRLLADVFANADIVVAPAGPSTHLYWSNRVYLTLSLGGFLIHPWCIGLLAHYRDGSELPMWRDEDELHSLIQHYRNNPDEADVVREAAYARTLGEHTYRHRCETLIREVERCLSRK